MMAATNTGNSGQVQVTADNQGPILAIVTWFLLTVMTLAVIARLTIKLVVRRGLSIEDFSVIAALLIGLGQSLAVSLAIKYGLGQRGANLSSESLVSIQQTQYAADLLYILSVGLAKVSTLQLLRALTVTKWHRKVTKAAIIVAIAWMIPSFFTLVFQCGASQPWALHSGHCINRFAFWAAISPIDILTELVVILLPMFMMAPVQVAFGKKVVVVVAFIFRLAVILITIIRLVLLHTYFSSADMVFDSIASSIASQCLLSITITTACIPSLKPFLDGFESGMLGITLKQRNGDFSGNSYEMNNANSGNRSVMRSQHIDGEDGGGYLAAISGPRSRSRPGETGSLDSGKSDAMIIKRTDQWDIRYESAHPSSLDPQKDVEDRL